MKDKLNEARSKINSIDKKIAALFIERMKLAEDVALYKKEHGLPVFDAKREADVIEKNSELIPCEYREAYLVFLKNVMSLSKERQIKLISDLVSTNNSNTDAPCVLRINSGDDSYPVTVGKGLINIANQYLDLERKVFIVTDSGVPNNYANAVEKICKSAVVYTVAQGESSKIFSTLESLLTAMAEAELGRFDCVVAIGGGVVGDLAGLAAAIYMRGIDFYNVPTTLLSQVDSSIGGKTAINLGAIKNTVGAFKQPKAVLIDVDTLSTLPERQVRNGMAEVIKMAATSNKDLFEKLENLSESEAYNNIEEIIVEALKIKKGVVEADEKENGIRKILNFGHTFGHAIESAEKLSTLLHGECVAIGMMKTSSGEARERIKTLLEKFSLPTVYEGDTEAAIPFISHDKKAVGGKISVALCEKIGECHIEQIAIDDFANQHIKTN